MYLSGVRPCNPATPGKGARRRRDSASRSICTQRLRRGHPYPLPLLVGYEKINLKCLHPSLTVRSLGIRSLSWQQRNGTSTCPMRRPWLTASAIISVANSLPGQVHMQRDAASRVMPRMPQWKSRTSVWKRQRASAERNFTPRIRWSHQFCRLRRSCLQSSATTCPSSATIQTVKPLNRVS